jgi:hypothetical protein
MARSIRNMEALMARHGIVMSWPAERNIIRLRAAEPDFPAQYALNGAVRRGVIDRGYMWRVALVAVVLLLVWGGLAVRLGQLHLGTNESLKARVRACAASRRKSWWGGGASWTATAGCWRWICRCRTSWCPAVIVAQQRQARAVSAHLARVLGLPFARCMTRVNRPGASTSRSCRW